MKKIILNGQKIHDMESFYEEIEQKLTKNLNWEIGHNLDAFNDVLRGGFGVHEYKEPIHIIWKHYTISKKNLGIEKILTILEIILNQSEHDCKLELDEEE